MTHTLRALGALMLLASACGEADAPATNPTSTGGSTAADPTESGGAQTGGTTPVPTATPTSTATTVPPPQGGDAPHHPLFGVGSYTGVDLSDPCNTVIVWTSGANFPADDPLVAGDVVRLEDTLWEYNGANSQTYMLETCTPGLATAPAWCATDWGWVSAGACDG